MPRAGTTSLAYWLDLHPDIVRSDPKEPGFYASDLAMGDLDRTRAGYERAFRHAGEAKYRLDATPWYLYSREAMSTVASSVPDARVIVVVRNPVDQLISQHRHHLKVGYESEPNLMRALSRRVKDPADFRFGLDYLSVARIGEQLERVLGLFNADRVFLGEFEQLANDPRALVGDICRWLGLDANVAGDFRHLNRGQRLRSYRLQRGVLWAQRRGNRRLLRSLGFRLGRLNLSPRIDQADDQVRRWLERELEPDIRKLEVVMGRSRSAWRGTSRGL